MAVALAVSVLPVFLFLGALVLLDSYKLIVLRAILIAVAAGVGAALAGYAVNVSLRPALGLDPSHYSVYVAPVVEGYIEALTEYLGPRAVAGNRPAKRPLGEPARLLQKLDALEARRAAMAR